MLYIFAVSAAVTAALLVMVVAQLLPARSAAVGNRVREVRRLYADQTAAAEKRKRQEQRERLSELLEMVGDRVKSRSMGGDAVQDLLIYAGYRHPGALSIYWGARIVALLFFGGATFLLATVAGASPAGTLILSGYVGLMAYILPLLHVRRRAKKRQKELQLALPDALDLLVTCVEAGLGLNQALLRVADEIEHISLLMSEELHLTNLEIRAGQPRDDAMASLARRTGVDDLRALVTMLVQADRFGTSIGTALRVQADTLREKRRQRAEEAAAKTTIKMVFPLVMCIFPAMLIVLVGPGFIQIVEALAGVG